MSLHDVLERLGACDESIEWVRSRGDALADAWAACERGDWLLWLVRRVRAVDDRTLRLIACDCAERAVRIYESRYPGDARPRRAIEAAREYARGGATADADAAANARSAYAAAAASSPAAWSGAAAAAAAADAVSYDGLGGDVGAGVAAYTAADRAADAAADAAAYADDNAWHAAREAELAEQAEIVRRYVSWRQVAAAIERTVGERS